MPLKIMMSAGEVSGDVHASYLARQLSGNTLFGMGGEHMRQAGVDVKVDITAIASVGIVEAIKHLPAQLSAFYKMKKLLTEERPDILILIDSQGFNMPLAKFAKKNGIRTVYYISPQEWLWGTTKGLVDMAKNLDLVISIFKKEHETNIAAGINSFYFGHPLLDIVRPSMSKQEYFSKYGLDPNIRIIALCPGSRPHEIEKLLPILIKASKQLGNCQLVMPVSSSKYAHKIHSMTAKHAPNIKVIEGNNYSVLKYCDLAIAKSGTIVLECVILNTPVIMFYKLSRLTYILGKYLLKIRLPYYSMPNLLVNKMIVPEFVMEEATPKNLVMSAADIIEAPLKETSGYKDVLAELGESGAINKAAQKIIEFASSK
jgi:lipid-A-disaccharide synthase